jgi:hypothetical protein
MSSLAGCVIAEVVATLHDPGLKNLELRDVYALQKCHSTRVQKTLRL